MIAEEFISNIVSPVRTSDTGEEVLAMMNLHHVRHLPIVNNNDLLGVISEDDILSNDLNAAIGSYSLSLTKPYVDTETNVFEIMNIIAENELTVVPVQNQQRNYKGVILLEDIVHYFSMSSTFTQPGAVLIVEMNRRDYSLAELAQIVESENALIIGLFVNQNTSNPNNIRASIKINKELVQHIIASLERYNYKIIASFSARSDMDDFQDRLDSFFNYLNM